MNVVLILTSLNRAYTCWMKVYITITLSLVSDVQ